MVSLLPIGVIGFHFDDRILRKLEVLDSGEPNAEPFLRRSLAIQENVEFAVDNPGLIEPAVAVEVSLQEVGFQSLLRCGAGIGTDGIASAELVVIKDGCMIRIEDRKVEGFAIGDGAKLHCVSRARRDEGKIRSAILEAGLALIAHQRRLIADQDQVQIVVVIAE